MSLLDLVQKELNNERVSHISNLIGEDVGATQTAITGALPALIGSLTQKASSAEGGSQVSSILGKLNNSVVANFGGILAGSNAPKLAQQGSSMLESLLGNEGLGDLSSAVSGFSGIGQESSNKLLGVLGPITMGAMKQTLTSEAGFDPSALAQLANTEQASISAALPEGFANHLSNATGLLGNMVPSLGQVAGVAGAATAAGAVLGGLQANAQDLTEGVGSNISDVVSGGLENAQGAASDAISAANDRLGDIASGALPDFSASDLSDNLPDLGAMAEGATQGAQDMAGGLVESATGAVTEGLSGLQDSASNAVSGLSEQLPDLGGLGGSVGEGLQGKADEFMGAASEQVTGAVSGLSDSLSGSVSGLADSANEAVAGLSEKLPDIPGVDMPDVGGMASNAVQGIQDQADGFLGAANDAVSGVGESIGSSVSGLADNATEAISGLGDKLPEVPDIGGIATNAVQDVQGQADSFLGAANDAVGGIGESIGGSVSGLADSANEAVAGLSEKLPDIPGVDMPDVGGMASNAVQGIQDQADGFMGNASDAVSGLDDKFSASVANAKDAAAEFGADAFNFPDQAEDGFGDFADSASGMANDVREHLQGGASDAVTAVGDAASGLKDATGEAMHAAGNATHEAAQQTKNAVGGATSGLTRILLPILVVAFVVWAIIYFVF